MGKNKKMSDRWRHVASRHSQVLSSEPPASYQGGTTSSDQESSCAIFTQPQAPSMVVVEDLTFLGPVLGCPSVTVMSAVGTVPPNTD